MSDVAASSREDTRPGPLERIKRGRPARVIAAYGSSKAGNYASGLAFNAFMSMFPLILGALAIVGVVISNPTVQAHVEDAMINAFPSTAHDELTQALNGVHDAAGLFGVISVLGLLFAGTNFFSALEFALDEIFGVPQRDFLRQRLMGMFMMVLMVVAIVVAVGANALMALVPVMAALGPVLGAVTMVVLLVMVYRVVPNRTFRVGEVWPGAVIAGILIEVITLVFPIYGKLAHGFNTYGNTFAIFFLLATWLSFVSQFILLGAVWNRVRIGGPDTKGLVATPDSESTVPPRPVEAIEQQREEARSEPGQPAPRPGPEAPATHVAASRSRSPLVILGAGLAAFIVVFLGRRHRA